MNYKLCEWITFFIHKWARMKDERDVAQAKDGLWETTFVRAGLCLLSVFMCVVLFIGWRNGHHVLGPIFQFFSVGWSVGRYFTIISFLSIFSRYSGTRKNELRFRFSSGLTHQQNCVLYGIFNHWTSFLSLSSSKGELCLIPRSAPFFGLIRQ